jgi:choice-of-anchor B domain-containing protein
MKKILTLFLASAALVVAAQDSLNVHFKSFLPYTQSLNDVWGYVDNSGNEFALVGTRSGFSVVDVSDASTPSQVLFIPGAFSVWRDIKTYSHYAYVVHDNFFSGVSDGILIVDLDSLGGATPTFTRFFPTLNIDGLGMETYSRAHNIYIDENGVLYLFGSNLGVGGAVLFDLTADPEAPVYLGAWEDQYLHDGMAKGDTLWGGAILDGRFYAIDVSNKAQPVTMGSHPTPNTFTHNIWVSDDNNTVFTTDEVSGGYIASYDVTDLNNIKELDKVQSAIGNPDVIPHNAHVYGDFVVNSFYTSGLQILDATYPDIMIEVGNYDTSDSIGDGYNGAWGAYPYLPSGNVLITDIEKGLFVLQPDYLKGCYLEVNVVDSVTKQSVAGAFVKLLNTSINAQADIFGKVRGGIEAPGTFDLVVEKAGYKTDTISISMNRGVMLVQRVALLPNDFSIEEPVIGRIALYPNPSTSSVFLHSNATFGSIQRIQVFTLDGVEVIDVAANDLQVELKHHLPSGAYIVKSTTQMGAMKPERLLVW